MSRLLSAMIVTLLLLISNPFSAHAGESSKDKHSYQCSVEQNKELKQFKGELKVAQQNLWDAEGEIKWLKAKIKDVKKDIKNATGAKKIKLQNKLSQYQNELTIAKQKKWDAEWEIDWLNDQIKKLEKEIKKLDKECDDNYGYGHEHGHGHDDDHKGKTWWKIWE